MNIGDWTDRFGSKHTAGMADYLLTPRILCKTLDGLSRWTAIPLWAECKSGSGDLTRDQKLFREDVMEAGAYHLIVRDSADALLAWFEEMGVRKW